MKKRLIFCAALFLAAVADTFACTNLIVGKNASTDGSTIVSYSADSYGLFGELYHYPAATYPKGTMLKVYEWDTGKYLGEIEQARQTYNVVGNMNEYQVTIGETTFGGRPELADSTGIIDYGSLIYIGLQRSRTAREAIKVMTDLVQQYGYYSEGESFTIADPNEIWIMEMIGKGPGIRGAVWVAVRVPDDCISAHANQSRIHQFDMNDKENCIYSPDVVSFAREKGYFSGVNKDFSFANAYAPLDFGARRFCEARVWSYFNKFTDNGKDYLPYIEGKTNTPMPLFVKPKHKLSVQDVKDMMRDHYEGTPLDISNDFGAGLYKTPYRLSPLNFKVGDREYFNERPISTQQSGFVFVAQMRANKPDPIGGVLWFGVDDANMAVFTPVYCCATKAPVCYTRVDGADYITFSWNSAFWIFNWVSNMVYPRYSLMIDDVRATQKELETTFNNAQEGIEEMAARLLAKDKSAAVEFLTNYTNMTAQSTFDTWKQLGTFLIVKYNDGVVKRVKDGKFERNSIGQPAGVIRPGYPKEFLEEYFQVVITENDIRRAIVSQNKRREALKRFYGLMKLEPVPMSGQELGKVLYGSKYQFGQEEMTKELNELSDRILEEYKKGRQLEKRPRILITGCPMGEDTNKIVEAIENNGGVVVGFENCTGAKAVERMVDEDDPDVYGAIAKKYFSIGCAIMTPNNNRIHLLGEMIDDYHVDGVVEMILSGCHSVEMESISVKNFVNEEKHLPYLAVVTDYSKGDVGQLNIRLAAFVEMIRK